MTIEPSATAEPRIYAFLSRRDLSVFQDKTQRNPTNKLIARERIYWESRDFPSLSKSFAGGCAVDGVWINSLHSESGPVITSASLDVTLACAADQQVSPDFKESQIFSAYVEEFEACRRVLRGVPQKSGRSAAMLEKNQPTSIMRPANDILERK